MLGFIHGIVTYVMTCNFVMWPVDVMWTAAIYHSVFSFLWLFMLIFPYMDYVFPVHGEV